MYDLYPGETKNVLDVFSITDWTREYMDVSSSPVVRHSFSYSKPSKKGEYHIIKDKCMQCNKCVSVFPTNCMDIKNKTIIQEHCLRCGEEMTLLLRVDGYYVEDDIYHKGYNNYVNFLKAIQNKKVLLIEIGVGFNTPVIIRYTFQSITNNNDNFTLVRMNKDYSEVPQQIKKKSISFNEPLNEIFSKFK